ncbi:ArsR/SmtB family transcription factor [Nocardia grenadensis]|uniref:ArsR/SmtB family transcription factor n=2 Tax=Nocardia grenadensis TaxID=931537 RepID=UPI000A049378
MAKYLESLDGVFAALSDPSRRAVVQRLGAGPASVGELARDLPITLPSFMKHLRVLENSGLIRTIKTGRVRRCELDRDRFALIDGWLAEQRQVWEARTDRLEQFLLTTEEPTDESRSRPLPAPGDPRTASQRVERLDRRR